MSPDKNNRQTRCVQSNRRVWGACCHPAARPHLPFVSPQPFMSPRYAGGPRPPIRMGNQVLQWRVSWGWLLFGEGGTDQASCRCPLGLDGEHPLPQASSLSWCWSIKCHITILFKFYFDVWVYPWCKRWWGVCQFLFMVFSVCARCLAGFSPAITEN